VKPLTQATVFEHTSLDQVRFHVLPTDQFKTYAIVINIEHPLTKESVTPIGLLPFVLRRGTERFPETAAFRQKLDELYGAGFQADIMKRGERQIVQLAMDIANPKWMKSSENLLEEGIRFLSDVLLRPALENGVFAAKYIRSEKDNMAKRIERLVDDKIRYASERCIQVMYKNEPYSLYPYGNKEDLDGITPENLHSFYTEWIKNSPIDIYIVGHTSVDEVSPLIDQYFNLPSDRNPLFRETKSQTNLPREEKVVVEKMDVSQGKLNMGLRTFTTYGDDDYPAMLVYNGILGGFPHSKLFVNVREKASLAYYAVSRLDGHQGVQTIQSGIQVENYEKAVEIIKKQLESVQNGEITDTELHQTIAVMSNQLREVKDMPFERINFNYHSVLSRRQRSLDELLAAVRQVTKNDIVRAAQKVKLDTIYFLRDYQEGSENGA
jgi:predicted Zn-dependent peptidase